MALIKFLDAHCGSICAFMMLVELVILIVYFIIYKNREKTEQERRTTKAALDSGAFARVEFELDLIMERVEGVSYCLDELIKKIGDVTVVEVKK